MGLDKPIMIGRTDDVKLENVSYTLNLVINQKMAWDIYYCSVENNKISMKLIRSANSTGVISVLKDSYIFIHITDSMGFAISETTFSGENATLINGYGVIAAAVRVSADGSGTLTILD